MIFISSSAVAIRVRRGMIVSVLCVAGSLCRAATVEQTIEDCWIDHDHPAMAICVAARASAERAHLTGTEHRMLAFIDASPELPQYITRARTAFVRSVRSYAAYRTDQCTLRAAVAGTGNGSEEVRHACEAALDRGRADQLDAAM
jgi:uncharacterized protein YecT (DUF1311 family)